MEFEITLSRLIFYSYHGVLEEERKNGNEFYVDLSVYISYKSEILKDNLSSTISYEHLFKIVEEEMGKPVALLETKAAQIYHKIKKLYPEIIRGKICIEKKRPPIRGMIGTASVSLIF